MTERGKGSVLVLGSKIRFLVPAALAAALVAVACRAAAGANASLTVQLVPGAISAGQPALAVATFQNIGSDTLPNVVVDLHFPSGHDRPDRRRPAATRPNGSLVNVVCSLGDVLERPDAPRLRHGATSRRTSVRRRASRSLFALRVGPGLPPPILTGASAQVLASTDSARTAATARRSRSTIIAVHDDQVTALPRRRSRERVTPAFPARRSRSASIRLRFRGVRLQDAGGGRRSFRTSFTRRSSSSPSPNETASGREVGRRHPGRAASRASTIRTRSGASIRTTGKLYVVPKCLRGQQVPDRLAFLRPRGARDRRDRQLLGRPRPGLGQAARAGRRLRRPSLRHVAVRSA